VRRKMARSHFQWEEGRGGAYTLPLEPTAHVQASLRVMRRDVMHSTPGAQS